MRRDWESGEWLFGRGSCDMKGGAAAQLAVFEDYAAHPGKASLIYLSLPDEETYSAGMRTAITLLNELRSSYGLIYDILIDSEPNHKEQGKLVLTPVLSAKSCPSSWSRANQSTSAAMIKA